MKYGIIKYNRKGVVNIGDDIQILATMKIYQEIDIAEENIIDIDFYDLTTYDGEEVILPICFPFFGYNETNGCVTCFSPKIHPVFLGLSLLNTNLKEDDINYLKQFEPIGCRDEHTSNGLKVLGIDAYLSGCITATFSAYKGVKKQNKIYFIDTYENLEPYIPEQIKDNAIKKSHLFYGLESNTDTISLAREILKEYCENASMVVTSRLHCAVPCMAMGIPVIFIHKRFNYRFTWLEDIMPVYTPDMYNEINWDCKAVKYEKQKKLIAQAAKNRLAGKPYKDEITELSSIYEKRKKRGYALDVLEEFKDYINKAWDKYGEYKYALWGVCQHASLIIEYIEKEYPNARLEAIIDTYKQMDFFGKQTQKIEELQGTDNMFFFVAASAAAKYAKSYFDKIGKDLNQVWYWRTQGI